MLHKKYKFWTYDFWYPNRLNAGTIEEWDNWHFEEQKRRPIKYWVLNDLKSYYYALHRTLIQNPKDYIRYRFFKKFHIVKLKHLTPGYYDIDRRMTYAMFSLLEEYIENELANMYEFSHKKESKGLTKIEKGLKRLKWEASLDDPASIDYSPEQAQMAKEVLTLYSFWQSKLKPQYDIRTSWLSLPNSNKYKLHNFKEYLDYEEETEMLIRLIKIRNGLWT